MSATQRYSGTCHCGRVRFEAEADLRAAIRCNCSLCARKGIIIVRIAESAFRLLAGEEHLELYQFHTMTAKHYFCRHCGIYTHHRPRTRPELIGVNVGCLAEVDAYGLQVQVLDGRSLP